MDGSECAIYLDIPIQQLLVRKIFIVNNYNYYFIETSRLKNCG